MRHLVREAGLERAVEIDSAATGAWHIGEQADDRTRAAGERRGFCVDSIARQVVLADFERFDYLVAMDAGHVRELERMAPTREARSKVRLLRSFDPASPAGAAVPDPYYGGADGFEEVLDICEAGCRGLLAELVRVHGLR